MSKKPKYTLKYFQELFLEKIKHDVVDLLIVNNKQYILYKCNCGNIFKFKYDYISKDYNLIKCNKCETKNKISEWYYRVQTFVNSSEGNGCLLETTLQEILLQTKSVTQSSNHKISFICACGETFVTTYNKFKHQNKRQCNECGKKILINKKRFSLEEVQEYVKTNSSSILLSKEYNNMKDLLKFKCSCGAIFETTFDSFKFIDKSKCNTCTNNALRELYSKGMGKFIEEVFYLVGNEYLVIGEYINNNTKIEFYHTICQKSYFATPGKFLSGNRCPHCAESKGEQKIRKFLEINNINHIPQFVFSDLYGLGGNNLRFDFAIMDKNNSVKLLIEYDGAQHYRWVEHFMTHEEFEKIQKHDTLKDNYCKNNGHDLIRITYEEFDNIEYILSNVLCEN